tara:strand:- start:1235 stop:1417 length:183 start_codon:yes stop_codon:yes gene_type:complete
MFITSAINLKVGIITGMVIGGAIAVTAKQALETRSCMSKCSNKYAGTDKEIKDEDEHVKD